MFEEGRGGGREPAGINLLDYGCIRIFPPKFVGGVVDLYNGLRKGDDDLIVHAYETWGFKRLSRELIDMLNIWARFIYGPLLEDRVRSLADGVKPAEYGRREAFRVHQALKQKGPVTVPREFVFMDRAAIGLGAVFLHLGAELNFHRLFEAAIGEFSIASVAKRQNAALAAAASTACRRRGRASSGKAETGFPSEHATNVKKLGHSRTVCRVALDRRCAAVALSGQLR